MTAVSLETKAEVVRLFYAEHWKVGTIAAQLGIHPDVVRTVIDIGINRQPAGMPRARLVDPYREFIDEALKRYPRLCATRLHDMLRERGFQGAVRTLRDHVACVRPHPKRKIYLRTEPLVGEQAQVDWGYVGKVAVPGGERALWLFVIVLSYSRALWAEFVIDLTVHSLSRSLVRAACAFGGVPREFLFDNPKTVVIERRGDAIRFHPVLLDLCSKLRVQPRLCAVACPEHKGRVERSIRYMRDRFLAGRVIHSVADGNAQLQPFLNETSNARPHPVLSPSNVGQIFLQEQPRLLALPNPLPETALVLPTTADRQAFVRFDTNRYSVPTEDAERPLTLVADDITVRLLHVDRCVAVHTRCFGRRQVIEEPAHRTTLVEQRRAAADLKGRDRLRAAANNFSELLNRWALAGSSLAGQVTQAGKLLDLYGKEVFSAAVTEIVERGLRDIGALAVACERLRRDRNHPLPLPIQLPAHVEEIDVITHNLEIYDDHD